MIWIKKKYQAGRSDQIPQICLVVVIVWCCWHRHDRLKVRIECWRRECWCSDKFFWNTSNESLGYVSMGHTINTYPGPNLSYSHVNAFLVPISVDWAPNYGRNTSQTDVLETSYLIGIFNDFFRLCYLGDIYARGGFVIYKGLQDNRKCDMKCTYHTDT